MKKLYTLALGALIAGSAMAQQLAPQTPNIQWGKQLPAYYTLPHTMVPNDTLLLDDFAPGGQVYLWGNLGGGYIFGNNVISNGPGLTEHVQGYVTSSNWKVIEGLIWFGQKDNVSNSNPNVGVKVWSLAANKAKSTPQVTSNDIVGPNTAVLTTNISLNNIDTTFLAWNVITFSPAPTFTGDFGIGIDVSALYTSGDTVSLLADANGDEFTPNYVWCKYGNQWYATNGAYGGQVAVNTSMFAVVADPTGREDLHWFNGLKLYQNYPNPVVNNTTINYELEKGASNVSLTIIDATGKQVAVIQEGIKGAGKYSINLNAQNIADGTYYFILKADGLSMTRKMTIAK